MRFLVLSVAVFLSAVTSSSVAAQQSADLRNQVRDAERAFARSMAMRDFDGFAALVSDEAIFFGGKDAQHGKAAVLAAWKGFFTGAAPFSWDPDTVEVLQSGGLGLTSGPVKDPAGKQIGVFNSIWRREGGGWKVIFDKGCPPCNCAPGL